MTEQFIVFDTEYASWQGFLDAPEEEKKKAEIVQIAALKINSRDLSVAEKLNLYVKPRFAPKLTDYFINLTGITDELLAQEGIPFPEAYARFKRFAGGLPCYSHAWQPDDDRIADGKVIGCNLDMFGIKDDSPLDCRNIAGWFKQAYRKTAYSSKNSLPGKLPNCSDLKTKSVRSGWTNTTHSTTSTRFSPACVILVLLKQFKLFRH